MIRRNSEDLDGDVARFSTSSPNEHDVLLESRDAGHQQVLPDVHEETWPKSFQSAESDILDSGSEQFVSNITTRPMATCVAILSAGKNMFTVAYCYQSTYYALKPNSKISNPPE
ncbi:hypothetical protein OUZ56_005383 [Daphnia magna]|uniref:Uncharacterized protein n=1 Tax=Daphnia magna TaxID=35525 RepID=A0ABQ9YSV2_9CRUS|nr:hypothetical protein OUZ56_005383 [Daphnia magna]